MCLRIHCMFVCVTVTFKIVTFPCVVKTACPHKINRIFLYCSYFFFFFFFLSLVRYINLICIISGKITDSQMTTVHPQCPQVQNKKKRVSHVMSMFMIFLCFCLSPLSPTVLWKPEQVNTHYILCAVELGRANGDKLGR